MVIGFLYVLNAGKKLARITHFMFTVELGNLKRKSNSDISKTISLSRKISWLYIFATPSTPSTPSNHNHPGTFAKASLTASEPTPKRHEF